MQSPSGGAEWYAGLKLIYRLRGQTAELVKRAMSQPRPLAHAGTRQTSLSYRGTALRDCS